MRMSGTMTGVDADEIWSDSFSDLRREQLHTALYEAFRQAEVDADPTSLLLAREFLGQLPIDATPPEVEIEEDGLVAFDWDIAPRATFTVTVLADGTLRYAGLFGFDRHFGYVRPRAAIPNDILGFIARASQGGR